MRPLVKHWRSKGVFIVLYLDDGWGKEVSFDRCKVVAQIVKNDILAAGLVPNIEKSHWVPSQSVDWLGMSWDGLEGSLKVVDRRISDILAFIDSIKISLPRVSARVLASFTGKIISLAPAIGSIAQLRTRYLYYEI
jgi:hypothetical protein